MLVSREFKRLASKTTFERKDKTVGNHWSLMRLIRLDLQRGGRLHSYMWVGWDWDGIGIGMVIIGRRKSMSTFGAYKFVLLDSYLDASAVQE